VKITIPARKEYINVRQSGENFREEKNAGERSRERFGPGRSEIRLCEDELQRRNMNQMQNWDGMSPQPVKIAEWR
jgi:hypothetical protein